MAQWDQVEAELARIARGRAHRLAWQEGVMTEAQLNAIARIYEDRIQQAEQAESAALAAYLSYPGDSTREAFLAAVHARNVVWREHLTAVMADNMLAVMRMIEPQLATITERLDQEVTRDTQQADALLDQRLTRIEQMLDQVLSRPPCANHAPPESPHE